MDKSQTTWIDLKAEKPMQDAFCIGKNDRWGECYRCLYDKDMDIFLEENTFLPIHLTHWTAAVYERIGA